MPRKSFTIRKALPSDAPGLTQCMTAAYQVYTQRMAGKPLPPMTVDYAREIAAYPVWVAESAGQVVGGLILMLEDDCLSIANVAVYPGFQGHGLGRSLLEFAEAEAVRLGYSELRLATHVLLSENVALYTHLGWQETGRDDTRVYMAKKLA